MATTADSAAPEAVIPAWVVDPESFCRWADSLAYPEKLRCGYLKGRVWVDLTREFIFDHNQVKAEIARILGNLVRADGAGYFCPDGVFLRNDAADVVTLPDALFVTYDALRTGRVGIVPGAKRGQREFAGSPEMVLEVVSESSVEKDTERLFEAYFEAGVLEYWLVDARTEPLRFDLFKRGANGFVAARRRLGWLKSDVFGRAFRLTSELDPLGCPRYTLDVRD